MDCAAIDGRLNALPSQQTPVLKAPRSEADCKRALRSRSCRHVPREPLDPERIGLAGVATNATHPV